MGWIHMPSPRTVLITGAAGGLGRAFAEGFAAQGDRIAVADINLDGAQETVDKLKALGADAAAFEGPSGFGVHHRTWASGVDPKINEPFVRVKV